MKKLVKDEEAGKGEETSVACKSGYADEITGGRFGSSVLERKRKYFRRHELRNTGVNE